MYEITTNYRNLKTKEQKEQFYKDMTVHQDKLPLIRFSDNTIVKSFYDLINNFFYQRLTTFNISSNDNRSKKISSMAPYQCSSTRRRSLLDFYLIQKYYLENPMSMERCANIYINKLERGLDKYFNNYKETYRRSPINYPGFKTDELINEYILNNNILYYCTTVHRNVFIVSAHSYLTIDFNKLKKNLQPYNRFKIKSNETI